MHSALPVSYSEKPLSGRAGTSARPGSWVFAVQAFANRAKVACLYNSRVQWLLAGLMLFLIAVHYLFNGGSSLGLSGVYNDAHTVTVVQQPYIYPDLTKIEEFRKFKTVEFKEGRKVASAKNAIIYKPRKSLASKFSLSRLASKYFFQRSAAGGELADADPALVMVLGLDADRYSKDYLTSVLADRLAYAKAHGYGLYCRYLQDFIPEGESPAQQEHKLDPLEWAKIHLMREAMFAFSNAAWMWWLEQDAVIMNAKFDIGAELVFDKAALSHRMLRDTPVIPPQSIIHTYKHVPADQIKLITTQNDGGISMSSFLIRNDLLYGRMLFDYLRDPLHRNYNGFRNAGSGSAVEAAFTHLVQWHPAILSKMALVSPSLLGALPEDGKLIQGTAFKEGGFVYLTKSSLLSHRGVQDSDYIAREWNAAKASLEPK